MIAHINGTSSWWARLSNPTLNKYFNDLKTDQSLTENNLNQIKFGHEIKKKKT